VITNAIDSMAATEDPRMLCVKSEPYERDGVMISVADSGAGISTQHIDRIFNALFTTKSDGMGMGLSICRAIIEAHEGRFWAERSAGHGFSIYAAQRWPSVCRCSTHGGLRLIQSCSANTCARVFPYG
jgi:signal transduction histidine kinase